MKPFNAVVIALACLSMAGCAGSFRPIVIVQHDTQFDLRVHVRDQFTHGGDVVGANVVVVQTGDHSFTGNDGRTRKLAVPPSGDGVDIDISYQVLPCYGRGDPVWKSLPRRYVPLRHGATEIEVWVDSRPF